MNTLTPEQISDVIGKLIIVTDSEKCKRTLATVDLLKLPASIKGDGYAFSPFKAVSASTGEPKLCLGCAHRPPGQQDILWAVYSLPESVGQDMASEIYYLVIDWCRMQSGYGTRMELHPSGKQRN